MPTQSNGSQSTTDCSCKALARRLLDWEALCHRQLFPLIGDFFTVEGGSTNPNRLRAPHKRSCAQNSLASEGSIFKGSLSGLQEMRQQGW